MKRLEDWIDYIEGDLGRAEKAECDLLLKHSLSDQLILDNLRRVRRCVENNSPTASAEKLLKDNQYLEKLHGQIMKAVKKETRKTPLTVISSSSEEALSTSERDSSRARGSYRL